MDYEPNSKGMAVVPQFPQVIPYNITYQWQPLQHDINLTLTFNQKDMSTFDLVQFFDGTETHSLNRYVCRAHICRPLSDSNTFEAFRVINLAMFVA